MAIHIAIDEYGSGDNGSDGDGGGDEDNDHSESVDGSGEPQRWMIRRRQNPSSTVWTATYSIRVDSISDLQGHHIS
jgi:hypothetical protein